MEFFNNTKQIEEAVRAVEMKYQGAINDLGFGNIELPDPSSLRATLNNDLVERWQSNQGFRDLVAANDFKMQWQEQFDQLQLDMKIHNEQMMLEAPSDLMTCKTCPPGAGMIYPTDVLRHSSINLQQVGKNINNQVKDFQAIIRPPLVKAANAIGVVVGEVVEYGIGYFTGITIFGPLFPIEDTKIYPPLIGDYYE